MERRFKENTDDNRVVNEVNDFLVHLNSDSALTDAIGHKFSIELRRRDWSIPLKGVGLDYECLQRGLLKKRIAA